MTIAAEAAPEIDRLVLSVVRTVGPVHGARLAEVARQCGLESLDLFPPLGDFMAAGRLTRDLALLRLRYLPPERILARLDELEAKGLLAETDGALGATPALRPLLDAMFAAQSDVAGRAWRGHPDDVAAATRSARDVARTASPEHAVAAVHRDLPDPEDPHLLLLQQLVTLRFVRQHDHAEAWLGHGLTAAEMVAFTALWHAEDPEDSGDALERLAGRGFVTGDPPRLTPDGREVREAIEEETNRRAAASFAVLDRDDADRLLAALRRLPSPST